MATVIVVLVIFALVGGILLFASGVLRFGSGTVRTVEEQQELFANGDCALRANGTLAGRVMGVLTPSRGMGKRRYQIAIPAQRDVVMVFAEEVTIVRCTPSLLSR